MSVPSAFPYPIDDDDEPQQDGAIGEHREWWRWHFAGQMLAATVAGIESRPGPIQVDPTKAVASALQMADLLIAKLEARP
jgi:hypothetical protein